MRANYESGTETLRTRVTVCVVLAVVLPLGLTVTGLAMNFVGGLGSLMGGTPRESGTGYLIAGAVLGIGLSVVGFAIAAETGQRTARLVLAVVLAITLLSLVLSFGQATTGEYVPPAEAPSSDGPPTCVEHSGGEATCPGG